MAHRGAGAPMNASSISREFSSDPAAATALRQNLIGCPAGDTCSAVVSYEPRTWRLDRAAANAFTSGCTRNTTPRRPTTTTDVVFDSLQTAARKESCEKHGL